MWDGTGRRVSLRLYSTQAPTLLKQNGGRLMMSMVDVLKYYFVIFLCK